jgi:hypothetical protein
VTAIEHDILWQLTKAALIAARRRKDDEAAKRLSQEREKLKRHRWCVDCGVPLSDSAWRVGSIRCTMHSNIHKFYPRALA